MTVREATDAWAPAEAASASPTPLARPRQMSFAFLGVVPFFVFAIMFLLWPTGFLVIGGFQDAEGHFTLHNIQRLAEPTILNAYGISIEISVASAVIGAIIGFFLAASVVLGGLPRWLRPTLMTFCG